MKYQRLFRRKNIVSLTSAEFSQMVVKVNFCQLKNLVSKSNAIIYITYFCYSC